MSKKQKPSSDLQGITRLVTDATIGVTDLVEAMHRRIVHPPFLPSTPIQNLITTISGVVYKNIRWTTRLIGDGADKALGRFAHTVGEIKSTDQREAIRAVLNGVVGDYLEENDNPLQISMQFRHEGIALPIDKKSLKNVFPQINGKILLMIHGSCMNDIQWTRNDHNHGISLAKELGFTPVFLHYNSGLHISTNGHNFNKLIEDLVFQWPVAVKELNILAHSMGGLVTRSAFHYGQQQQRKWIKHLKKIIFLGTPHHGSPLEKAGNYVDVVLEAVPYAKPFARLGKIRSAGVTDLRYGNILDEDWKDSDRFEMKKDKRITVPLPKKVSCYSIAAVARKATASKSSQMLGDNMVPVKSALGLHKNADKALNFKKENTWIAYENNHIDLLSDKKIYDKIREWMV